MWVKALALNELKDSKRHKISLNDQEILLVWHMDEVFAVESKCPHLRLPLTKATLTDDCEIVCPFHKSAFDLKTGDVACWSPWPPLVGTLLGKVSREKKLKIYPTRIENDLIWVDA